MQPKCVLVAGNEERFVEPLQRLTQYLDGIGCEVELHMLPQKNILRSIRSATRSTSRSQTLLFVYNGHGNRRGWEGGISYLSLLWCLVLARGDLVVVNDTCYGYRFLKYLRFVRRSKNTSFISPWDSEGRSYGGPVRDMLEYWPQGTMAESEVSCNIFSSEAGDVEVPIQLRWGAVLDHRFFPA